MKHIKPTITCLLTAHMKPYLWDALESATSNTRTDVAIVVIDSGQWIGKEDQLSKAMEHVYSNWFMHPMVDWYFTGEPANFKEKACPVGYWLNRAYELGMIRGEFFCTFYDDDKYHPQFFERMAGYLEQTPEAEAVRCSQEWIALDGSVERPVRVLRADAPLPGGMELAGVVDGGQVMVRTSVLEKMDKPLIPEDPATCRISDGLYFNNLSRHVKQIDNIDEILYTHRFTPISTYTTNKMI